MKYTNPNIESSYRENDIGRTLYHFVINEKPKKIIEFGTLNGYSAVAMAMALHELGEGKVICYDLWDKYPYKHSSREETQRNIDKYGLSDFIELKEGDFFSWKPESFDLCHLDISNTGQILRKAKEKFENNGIVIFEGGSDERDMVEWMQKYDKEKIRNSIDYKIIDKDFPSLSQML